MTFQIPDSAIDLADEISIGDLLRVTDQADAQMGVIRCVSMTKSQLERKRGKTPEDKNLLLDLIELVNEIGKEQLDEAINPNRRKADIVRLQRAGR